MSSIDQKELVKFNKTYKEWWDTKGEFKMLHKISPLRLEYIMSKIRRHYSIEENNTLPLDGLTILDVGCGGGLLSIPLSKFGGKITAIDANESNVKCATEKSNMEGIKNIDFGFNTVENLLLQSKQFDIVIALEIIEHVANPKEFIHNLCKSLKPGGMLIVSTLNRTVKSYFNAIIMAEYVLRWVKPSTHDYSKFIKPSELSDMLNNTKFSLKELTGLNLDIATNKWYLSRNIDVNYFAYIG